MSKRAKKGESDTSEKEEVVMRPKSKGSAKTRTWSARPRSKSDSESVSSSPAVIWSNDEAEAMNKLLEVQS